MAFLKDLLSPGPGASDEFSREWQDAFGLFDPPTVPPQSAAVTGGPAESRAPTEGSGPAARPPSGPPSPTGFLPSQLLDHSLSSTGEQPCPLLERESHCSSRTHLSLLFLTLLCLLGWSTPPMFQAPPLQPPPDYSQSAQPAPSPAANGMFLLNSLGTL